MRAVASAAPVRAWSEQQPYNSPSLMTYPDPKLQTHKHSKSFDSVGCEEGRGRFRSHFNRP
jgi:hypothetical protein